MRFDRYIGIDYSGAKSPTKSLKGLRVYMAEGDVAPEKVCPPCGHRKHWSRKGIAEWLVEQLRSGKPTLVGIDHGFSFPQAYFREHGLDSDWTAFLEDFQRHWPTDQDDAWVRDIRGRPAARVRLGEKRWFRATEARTKRAKSVFNFDVKQGCVAYSTHAGIPWLFCIRQQLPERVHFWPFDGWKVPEGRSTIAEVYPALWNRKFDREGRTPDQHDAYCVALWLARADRDGRLEAYLQPKLERQELDAARYEGWILGVPDDAVATDRS